MPAGYNTKLIINGDKLWHGKRFYWIRLTRVFSINNGAVHTADRQYSAVRPLELHHNKSCPVKTNVGISMTHKYQTGTYKQNRSTQLYLNKDSRNQNLIKPPPPPNGSTGPSRSGPPHYRGFTITLRRTTLGRTLLDEPEAETRAWQHTTLTRDRHPCTRQDLNQFQQASGRNPTPYIARPMVSECNYIFILTKKNSNDVRFRTHILLAIRALKITARRVKPDEWITHSFKIKTTSDYHTLAHEGFITESTLCKSVR